MGALSPDMIINIAFGSVMVLIGLVGIWIVKWSTDKMVAAAQHRADVDEESLIMMAARGNTMEEMSTESSSATLTPELAQLSRGSLEKVTADLSMIVQHESNGPLRSNSW